MTLEELANILVATGYSVAYSHFKEETKTPFITYRETMTDNFKADNHVYKKIPLIDVELYTDKKDLAAENKLETLFDQHEIAWNSTETFVESENIFQRIYELKLI